MTRRILEQPGGVYLQKWSQVWIPTDLWRAVQELGRAWRPKLSGAAMLRHLLEEGLERLSRPGASSPAADRRPPDP